MEFIEHLSSYLSKDEIDNLIISLDKKSLNCAVLNPSKISDETFVSLYPNVIPHPIVKHAFIYDKDEYPLGKTILHQLGAFYLQEPSAAVPAFLLSPDKDEIILDMCSAPGGKAVQSSFIMENTGLIICNDLSYSRSNIIVDNAERLGISNFLVISNDFSKIAYNFENKFDKIILDAPCSGSGMFRKNELMKNDWTYAKVLKNQAVQKELIILSYSMLKPGGVISYSTCSFSKEEDEDVIEYLLSNTDAEINPIADNPLYRRGVNGLGIHLLPSVFPGEGHYICQIKKPGVLQKHVLVKKESSVKELELNVNLASTIKYGSAIFGANVDFPINKFNVLRYGVKLGEVNKGYYTYTLHLARFLTSFENEIEIDENEVISYLKGEPINKEVPKGYILLKHKGLSVDLAKSDGKIIKNHYPKYLRGNWLS